MATIEGSGSGETLTGNDSENDSLWGIGSGDVLYGGPGTGGGDDFLDGGTGSDVIYGGTGNDTLIGGSGGGSDLLYGGAGVDTADYSRNLTDLSPIPIFSANISAVTVNLTTGLATGLGNDTLVGIENVLTGSGADFVTGNAQANRISLGGGADTSDGAAGDDTISGEAGADSLLGSAGNDQLYGGADADRLYGGIDNDYLDGGAGIDFLYGGSGSDTLVGSEAGDELFGGQGFDFADYSGSNNSVQVNLSDGAAESGAHAAGDILTGIEGLIGSAFNDSLVGTSDANVIFGGDGADTIVGGFGNDSIVGGSGNDVIDAGPDTPPAVTPAPAENLRLDWDAQPGGTTTSFEAGFSQTVPGAGGTPRVSVSVTYTEDDPTSQFTEDDLPGGGAAGPIYAGPTDFPDGRTFDTGSAGVLYRDGGPGVSEVTIDFAAAPGSGVTDQVSNVYFRISDIDTSNDATGFRDTVTVNAYDAFGNLLPVTITVGSSQLVRTGNTVTAVPQPGDPDGFNTSPGAEAGSVLYYIPGPVASIVIQYGDAGITGTPQAINVSDVHFTTIPESAATADDDTVAGGLGDDFLQAGLGEDLLYGDEGRDTLSGEAGNDTLYGGVENDLIYGGTEDDQVFGGADQDTLYGDVGNDTLLGGDGADRVFGGLGNDSIEAGDGADLVDGGEGNDRLIFGSGNDTVYGGAGDDTIDDVPFAALAGSNLIYGGDGSDTVWAGDDADTLYGDAGPDVLNGEAGNDRVFGGTGNDQLYGGDGVDTLFADDGNDTLYGEVGNDVLYGGLGSDSIYGGDDRDLISAGFVDVTGPENVFGGGGGDDNDTLRVDITGFGWARIDLVYDPLNAENGTLTFFAPDGITPIGTLNFTDIENLVIVCFTAGTCILTAQGPVPVESLAAGDMVVTRDNGLQPLRWVGRRILSKVDLQARPELQPVRISAGALGSSGPDRSIMLSPQHRVLVEGARAEMYFGESEVLVPAKHLIGLSDVSRALPAEGVTYVHILFDKHEIVLSDGIWTESFQPAERTLNALEDAARAEVLALFPELGVDATSFPAARLSLKAHEARVLILG
ncbi:MAG: Hint domain-containing protein [Tabrizicola sp.]|uniref:Hint domain-containing protein n=1 Tax=Tabrizicola sp. TaxID=2005166 RepID=UPI002ABB4EF4|nr:Hint domain-containing protein [Tabrizicola sp.]MDZ4087425.1 Hint domain-containing protein [Tabrizicola sp.]